MAEPSHDAEPAGGLQPPETENALPENLVAGPGVQSLLDAQRDLIGHQIEELQRIVVLQCRITGTNPLSQEMAAAVLGTRTGRRSGDSLTPKALKCLYNVFSIKDTVTKKEAREISALCGATVTQVREFFAGQRSRVRRLVQQSHADTGDGTVLTSSEPWHPNSFDNSEEREKQAGLEKIMEKPLPKGDRAHVGSRVDQLSECLVGGLKDKTILDLSSWNTAEIAEALINLMQKEHTFAGQIQLIQVILQAHQGPVLRWFIGKGGLQLLSKWMIQAASEEQTSLLRLLLKAFVHLPLGSALPRQMSLVLQTVNKLRFYRVQDVAGRARLLLSRWSRFLRSTMGGKMLRSAGSSGAQALQKRSRDASVLRMDSDILRKKTKTGIIVDFPGSLLEPASSSLPEKAGSTRRPMVETSPELGTSKKRLAHALLLADRGKERRKVRLFEEAGLAIKRAKDTEISRSANVGMASRPLSADDIQKAKRRAHLHQSLSNSKEGKPFKWQEQDSERITNSSGVEKSGASTDNQESSGKAQGNFQLTGQLLETPQSSLLTSYMLVQDHHEDARSYWKAPENDSCAGDHVSMSEVDGTTPMENNVLCSRGMGKAAQMLLVQPIRDAMNDSEKHGLAAAISQMEIRRLPWSTAPRIALDPRWRVAAGEGSTERDVQSVRLKMEQEVFYASPDCVPSNPDEPLEKISLFVDDTHVPEILLEAVGEDSQDRDSIILSHQTEHERAGAGAEEGESRPAVPSEIGSDPTILSNEEVRSNGLLVESKEVNTDPSAELTDVDVVTRLDEKDSGSALDRLRGDNQEKLAFQSSANQRTGKQSNQHKSAATSDQIGIDFLKDRKLSAATSNQTRKSGLVLNKIDTFKEDVISSNKEIYVAKFDNAVKMDTEKGSSAVSDQASALSVSSDFPHNKADERKLSQSKAKVEIKKDWEGYKPREGMDSTVMAQARCDMKTDTISPKDQIDQVKFDPAVRMGSDKKSSAVLDQSHTRSVSSSFPHRKGDRSLVSKLTTKVEDKIHRGRPKSRQEMDSPFPTNLTEVAQTRCDVKLEPGKGTLCSHQQNRPVVLATHLEKDVIPIRKTDALSNQPGNEDGLCDHMDNTALRNEIVVSNQTLGSPSLLAHTKASSSNQENKDQKKVNGHGAPDPLGIDVAGLSKEACLDMLRIVLQQLADSSAGSGADLELLAIFLKNPDLVYAFTSGRANDTNGDVAKVADLLKGKIADHNSTRSKISQIGQSLATVRPNFVEAHQNSHGGDQEGKLTPVLTLPCTSLVSPVNMASQLRPPLPPGTHLTTLLQPNPPLPPIPPPRPLQPPLLPAEQMIQSQHMTSKLAAASQLQQSSSSAVERGFPQSSADNLARQDAAWKGNGYQSVGLLPPLVRLPLVDSHAIGPSLDHYSQLRPTHGIRPPPSVRPAIQHSLSGTYTSTQGEAEDLRPLVSGEARVLQAGVLQGELGCMRPAILQQEGGGNDLHRRNGVTFMAAVNATLGANPMSRDQSLANGMVKGSNPFQYRETVLSETYLRPEHRVDKMPEWISNGRYNESFIPSAGNSVSQQTKFFNQGFDPSIRPLSLGVPVLPVSRPPLPVRGPPPTFVPHLPIAQGDIRWLNPPAKPDPASCPRPTWRG